ncbi:MAG: putative sulfate exporter family transporter [Spirochaetia bacterium]
MRTKTSRALGFLTGLILVIVVALLALYLSALFHRVIRADWLRPIMSANVVLAIVLGMLINNLILERFPRVTAFIEPGLESFEFLLKVGVIFLGARIIISDLLRLGGIGLGMVVVEIAFSLAFVAFFARLFKLPEKLGSLLAVGVAVCGVSAIIGASGAINARKEDANYAIATILIFGAGAMVAYPLIGRLLNMTPTMFGVWAGLAVDNTAESVATGQLYDQIMGTEGALQGATITKMSRNALMGFIILGLAVYYASKGMTDTIAHKGKFLWAKFPKFVLGFVLFAILASAGVFGEPGSSMLKAIKALEKWAFLLTFAGVGLRTRFSDMGRAGWKPFVVGISTEAAVAAFTLAMVLILGGYLTLSA